MKNLSKRSNATKGHKFSKFSKNKLEKTQLKKIKGGGDGDIIEEDVIIT